jgi:putative endonuclease
MLLGAFQPPKPSPTQGWRREKKLNIIRTINPECKDFAQTWGRKMITVHEKMYP